ncbi:hypothetical protein PR048_016771 [Dryococelus australis]|uniref:DDE Tnp4 domain-containing protein n=1 Tax=Dryococelus australis TaxID=614101 RepID=A0ABQ9H7M5_9NEOP|nr:hypothetical protein PR048_016771 [Dryococelus australis]
MDEAILCEQISTCVRLLRHDRIHVIADIVCKVVTAISSFDRICKGARVGTLAERTAVLLTNNSHSPQATKRHNPFSADLAQRTTARVRNSKFTSKLPTVTKTASSSRNHWLARRNKHVKGLVLAKMAGMFGCAGELPRGEKRKGGRTLQCRAEEASVRTGRILVYLENIPPHLKALSINDVDLTVDWQTATARGERLATELTAIHPDYSLLHLMFRISGTDWLIFAAELLLAGKFFYTQPMRVTEVNVERRRNEGAGETGEPREKIKTRRPTASSGTIPTCESPATRPGIEPGPPWWEASVLTAQPPRPQGRPRPAVGASTLHDGVVRDLWSLQFFCYRTHSGFRKSTAISIHFLDRAVTAKTVTGKYSRIRSQVKRLADGSLSLPKDKPLPGMQKPMPYVTVGDEAFPLKPYLMRPYPGAHTRHVPAFSGTSRISKIFSAGTPDGNVTCPIRYVPYDMNTTIKNNVAIFVGTNTLSA